MTRYPPNTIKINPTTKLTIGEMIVNDTSVTPTKVSTSPNPTNTKTTPTILKNKLVNDICLKN